MTEYCTRIPADHVPDPYFGGAEGLKCTRCVGRPCAGLLTSYNLRIAYPGMKAILVFLEYTYTMPITLKVIGTFLKVAFSNLDTIILSTSADVSSCIFRDGEASFHRIRHHR